MFYSEGGATFQYASRAGLCQGTFEIVSNEVPWSVRGSYQYEVPLSRMLHDIFEDDHIHWHSPLIRHYTNFDLVIDLDLITEFDFLPNCARFPWNICNGCGMPTPNTWSCPTLGLACVLMLRPISPELVLFPDFWVSNISRYFYFALDTTLAMCASLSVKNMKHHWQVPFQSKQHIEKKQQPKHEMNRQTGRFLYTSNLCSHADQTVEAQTVKLGTHTRNDDFSCFKVWPKGQARLA